VDADYEGYFKSRLETISRLAQTNGDTPDAVGDRIATRALDAARSYAADRGQYLRPDGALFIYMMSREFVAQPVATSRGFSPDLEDTVVGDAVSVVSGALETGPPSDSISAHRLIDSLSGAWDRLRSGQVRIWDDYH